LDANLRKANSLSFHPNDCRGTVVIKQSAFERYLQVIGKEVEWIPLYE
jgi:Ala-tRNA(Pro) deacylase